MISNDDSLISSGLGSLYHVADTVVYGNDSLGDSIVYTSVSNHIAIGKVDNDEIVEILLDILHQFLLYLVS